MNTTKYDEIIYARVPRKLKKALERERRCVSQATGKKVETSAVIRALLERALFGPQKNARA